MKNFFVFFSLALFSLLPYQAQATHIVGGEMYYEHVAGDQYKITLYVYRDCFNGIPGFDSPGYIAVFDTAYNRIMNLAPLPSVPERIPLDNYDSCTWVDTVCYEIAKYEAFVNLPNIPGGYKLVYDRCCWNYSVINIFFPDERGLSVTTEIPDSVLAYHNNSPVFNKRTPVFFCVNEFFGFDHSATDPDGDSLSYELFTPFNSSRMNNSHLAPLPGPYNALYYSNGYSLDNMFGGDIPLAIDSVTGYLTTTHDNEVAQYVFGVRVKEYRNGLYIGQSSRTYQINSQQCRRFTKANFTSPIVQCGDSVVLFDNKSDSAISYLWHFGDLNSQDTVSVDKTPQHVYSGMGKYTVQLIAYSHQGDECNDTTEGTIQLYPDIVGEFVFADDKCTNFVQFSDSTDSPSGPIVSWQWDFGDGSGATVPYPLHQYDLGKDAKSYLVTLYIENDKGCVDSVSQIYTGSNRKYSIKSVSATKYNVYPRDDSTLLSVVADSAASYQWLPEEGLSDPKSSSTYAFPKIFTTYTVEVKDGRGCIASTSLDIDVYKYTCSESAIYVPNAFSPNGDGENDYLRVRGEEIKTLRLSIYNRWGQLVYESESIGMTRDVSLGWDGRFNGEMQDPGVYVFTLDVQCSDNRTFSKKGNITLIR